MATRNWAWELIIGSQHKWQIHVFANSPLVSSWSINVKVPQAPVDWHAEKPLPGWWLNQPVGAQGALCSARSIINRESLYQTLLDSLWHVHSQLEGEVIDIQKMTFRCSFFLPFCSVLVLQSLWLESDRSEEGCEDLGSEDCSDGVGFESCTLCNPLSDEKLCVAGLLWMHFTIGSWLRHLCKPWVLALNSLSSESVVTWVLFLQTVDWFSLASESLVAWASIFIPWSLFTRVFMLLIWISSGLTKAIGTQTHDFESVVNTGKGLGVRAEELSNCLFLLFMLEQIGWRLIEDTHFIEWLLSMIITFVSFALQAWKCRHSALMWKAVNACLNKFICLLSCLIRMWEQMQRTQRNQ